MTQPAAARLLFRLYAAAFALVLVAVAYWQEVRGADLATDTHNRRYWAMVQGSQRGLIKTVDGKLLADRKLDEKGPVRGKASYSRTYPAGAGYAHVLGYSSWKVGETGVESALNQWLVGEAHAPAAPKGWQGWLNTLLLEPERVGDDITLTIRDDLQRVAVESLGHRRGAVVAIDVQSGEILAMTDWPRFDLNTVADQMTALQKNEDHPLLPRAYQGKYPPGSVFKVMTAAAALQAGVVSPDTTYECPGTKQYRGYRVVCHYRAGHGRLTLAEGIAKSCNIALAETAVNLGAARFSSIVESAGLASRPAIYLPGEDSHQEVAAGKLPSVDKLDTAMLAACGYGQGELLVTPLWVASLGQTLGHGGLRLEPRLVKQITAPDGRIVYKGQPRPMQQVVDSAVAAEVVRMMRMVMEPGGTASFLGVRGVNVAGKTGSAQNPHGQAHSWFLALAPAEAPKVAVAALVENGGAGGRAAGPITMAVLRQALRGQ